MDIISNSFYLQICDIICNLDVRIYHNIENTKLNHSMKNKLTDLLYVDESIDIKNHTLFPEIDRINYNND